MQDNIIENLNNKVISSLEQRSIGLATGKMGACIYFIYLYHIDKKEKHRIIAEKLLEEVFSNISELQSINIIDGLAGVGLGADFLIKSGFVDSNVKDAVNKIDNIIYKNLNSLKNDDITISDLTHVLYYLAVRLEKHRLGNENKYLLEELIIYLLNALSEMITSDFFDESLVYKFNYQLPQFLLVTNKLIALDFYNDRILRIIMELSPYILSKSPILHINKLYLLRAMQSVDQSLNNKNWKNHIALLKRELNVKVILNKELKDKNIYFNDGLSSLYILLTMQNDFSSEEMINYKKIIISKIKNSSVWNLLQEDASYFNSHCGLYSGFLGVALMIKMIENNIL